MGVGDWKPLPGTKGARYVNTKTGEVTSKRQYQNMQAREKGWSSYSEFVRYGTQLTPKAKAYRDQLRLVAETEGLEYKEVRKLSSVYHEKRGKAIRLARRPKRIDRRKGFLGWKKGRNGKRVPLWHPDSDIADFLIYIGRRKPEDRWAVGDTPPKKDR